MHASLSDAGDDVSGGGGREAARLSLASLFALVLVVLAVAAGCGGLGLTLGVAAGAAIGSPLGMYGVWAAPVLSLVGVGLGLWGLRTIRMSEGAVVGKPAALLGVFVGIAVTALLGAVALASLATLGGPKRLAPEVARLVMSSGEGRFADARRVLGESARASLSDEELAWFAEQVAAEVGAIEGADADVALIAASRAVLAASPGAADAALTVEELPRPVWVLGGGGEAGERVIVYGWVDEDALQRGEVLVKDAALVTGANEVAVLRYPGPAASLALKLGWEVRRYAVESSDQEADAGEAAGAGAGGGEGEVGDGVWLGRWLAAVAGQWGRYRGYWSVRWSGLRAGAWGARRVRRSSGGCRPP